MVGIGIGVVSGQPVNQPAREGERAVTLGRRTTHGRTAGPCGKKERNAKDARTGRHIRRRTTHGYTHKGRDGGVHARTYHELAQAHLEVLAEARARPEPRDVLDAVV